MSEIKGFLHTMGRKIVNGLGEEILLTGWGLGNWLLPEGYMWLADSTRFDRPRRIEQVIEELTGKAYARKFWEQFRRDYIRKEDIMYMAELGYNSVRIPINWRVIMEEGPGITWKEEGFVLLDECLEWCEEAGMYAFLDLHGAPGGQTGANIDDSVDNVPRLFIDPDNKEKALSLWRALAIRYGHREVVGGYDLLNEPIAPPSAGYGDYDYLIPELKQFYREAVAVIRAVDPDHLLSIEGAHWATDTSIFNKKYDDNMVLHFHRYAEMPQKKIFEAYLERSEALDIPLWLGETGENVNEWYAALYPLAFSLGIGYNLWPWKKMDCTNSPCSIKRPAGYEMIMDYLKGGTHPGFEAARKILDEYLHNIKLENCILHPEVTRHVFRQVPFSMLAVDFDEVPGRGISYSGTALENPDIDYRRGCQMQVVASEPLAEKRFAFDCGWDCLALILTDGEFAEYTISGCREVLADIECTVKQPASLLIEVKGSLCVQRDIDVTDNHVQAFFLLSEQAFQTLRITVVKGCVELKRLTLDLTRSSK